MVKPSLITGAIVLAFAWHVGYHHYQESQHAIATIARHLREEQATQALRAGVAQSLGELEQFRRQLSPARDTEWLVGEVSRLAQDAGIRLSAIVQQEPRTVQGFTHLAVTLQVNASYHQLGQFVSTLENAPVFLRVDEVTLDRKDQEGASVRMTVSTLYMPHEKNHT